MRGRLAVVPAGKPRSRWLLIGRGNRSIMRASFSNLLRLPAAVLLLAATVLSGCATPPTDPDELAAYKENNDPLEPMNRYFFEVNYGLDELLIKPIAAWYNADPADARRAGRA